MKTRLRFPRRLSDLPSFNSLRLQLLLWIALPVAVSLLGMSAVEVRGHEQAMTQMVQQQADIVAHSLGVAIDAHIEQHQAVLQRYASTDAPDSDLVDVADPAFAAGIARLPSAEPGSTAPSWTTDPAVVALVDEVRTGQVPGLATVYDETQQTWLLVQAVPIPASDPLMALVGAEPVEVLIHNYLAELLNPAVFAQLELMTSRGELLYSYTSNDVAGADAFPRIIGETIILPLGWRVLVHKDWRATVAPVLTFGNILLATAAVTTVLALVSAYFGLRNIVWPLQRLDEAAGQVGWGDFAAIQHPVGGIAEIEELRLALARMTEQIRQYQQDLQSYIGAMTLGQEDERRRLARELHDETVQDLIALNQQVEMIERSLVRDPAQAARRLHELRPQITAILDGLRRQIHALRPLYLEDLGFVPAIEMLLRQVTQRHDFTSNFTVRGNADGAYAPDLQISVFRIVQEALQNIVKHAEASHVDLELAFSDNELVVIVRDDGRGFDVPRQPFRLAQQGHYGLLGMKERAELYGGTLLVESRPGEGTRITVSLPRQSSAKPFLLNSPV